MIDETDPEIEKELITGRLTLRRNISGEFKIDPEICEPYTRFLGWENKYGTEGVRLSTKLFNSAQSFPAEFHSPVLTLSYSYEGDRGGYGKGSSFEIFIERKDSELVREIFGSDYEKGIDLIKGDAPNGLSTLLKKCRLGISGGLGVEKILETIPKNEQLFGEGPLQYNSRNCLPAHYVGACLNIQDIAYSCPDLIGNVVGTLGINRQVPIDVCGTGYVTISREDYLGLEKPHQLFVRALSIGQEEEEKQRIRRNVSDALEELSIDKTPEQLEELVETKFEDFLGGHRASYRGR